MYNKVWKFQILQWPLQAETAGYLPITRQGLDFGRRMDRYFKTDRHRRPTKGHPRNKRKWQLAELVLNAKRNREASTIFAYSY
jgi:hypothetical protein